MLPEELFVVVVWLVGAVEVKVVFGDSVEETAVETEDVVVFDGVEEVVVVFVVWLVDVEVNVVLWEAVDETVVDTEDVVFVEVEEVAVVVVAVGVEVGEEDEEVAVLGTDEEEGDGLETDEVDALLLVLVLVLVTVLDVVEDTVVDVLVLLLAVNPYMQARLNIKSMQFECMTDLTLNLMVKQCCQTLIIMSVQW